MQIFALIAVAIIFKVLVRQFFILLLLLLSQAAVGQDPYYIPITKANGLPSNTVYFLFQDSKGFVWMAHDEGLSRYDGFEFKNFGIEAPRSKAGTDIAEDRFGRIWYCNFDGYLFYVERDTMKALKQNKPLGYVRYSIMDDHLLVLQQKGIDIYDLRDLKLIRTIKLDTYTVGSIAGNSRFMCMSKNDTVFVVDKEGNISGRPFHMDGFMYPSGEGVVNIRRDNDLKSFIYYDGSKFTRIKIDDIKYIQGYIYTDNKHWICTANGLWAYDESGSALNKNRPFFPKANITGVLVDKEHNYWISTQDQGVLFIPDINTRLIDGNIIASNLLDQNGTIFVTSKKNSIYRYEADRTLTTLYKDKIEHPIYALAKRSDNDGYMLLSKGLDFLDGNFRRIKTFGGAYKDIKQIDAKYCAFAGSQNSGLIVLNEHINSEWDSIFNISEKLMIPACRLIETGRGRLVEWMPEYKTIYFGANNGLFRANPHAISEVHFKGEKIVPASMTLAGNTLYVIDIRGRFLEVIADEDAREISIADKQLKLFKVKNVSDDLVIVTSNGILQYMTATRSSGKSFTTAIPGEEINDVLAVSNGLLVATDKGLFFSESSKPFKAMPNLHILSLTANGKAYDPAIKNTFDSKENDIEIRYSIFSYRTGGNYPLYYRINNGAWQINNDKGRSLKLASLSPGSYTVDFRFKEDEQIQSLHFNISKPLWLRWWFLLLSAMIVITAGICYYRWQTGLLKKKNVLLLEKIDLEKNLHSSMLTSIKSQMNPHFFYNALNTIQSYIFSDDKRNATTYLSKFSKLTRTILEMSEKETVTLSEEIAALTLYLELEKARFDDSIDFTINTSPGLDADIIRLPSMIIQPYVENSIKHGLLHRKGEKKLILSFEVKDNNLCVVIDDNGIGRKKSEELNKIRSDKHKPFATEANLKRIEILNRSKENIGVQYIDKVNELGQATGTTLIISIPLVKETKHAD